MTKKAGKNAYESKPEEEDEDDQDDQSFDIQ